ncbi:hypothetical protein [Streptomyces sp. NPDC005283]
MADHLRYLFQSAPPEARSPLVVGSGRPAPMSTLTTPAWAAFSATVL